MSSGASIAMSAAAMSAASSAEAAARRAECHVVLQGYDAKTADVAGMRSYAACVREVHGTGEPMSAGAVAVAKVFICLALAFAVIGAAWGLREDGVLGAIMGVIASVGVTLLVISFTAAIAFLVSA